MHLVFIAIILCLFFYETILNWCIVFPKIIILLIWQEPKMAIDIPYWLKILLIWFGQKIMKKTIFTWYGFFYMTYVYLFFKNRVRKYNKKK